MTYKQSITCHIAKKVLDDIRSISPTKRLSWGSRQCRVNRILRTSRRIISLYRNRPAQGAGHSDEPFKPLNLTYSLVKELPENFSGFRQVRMRLLRFQSSLIRTRPTLTTLLHGQPCLPFFDSSPILVGDLCFHGVTYEGLR